MALYIGNQKVKVRTGLVKYTVVGTPTINNGVVSGFSANDYVQMPKFTSQQVSNLYAKGFEIQVKATMPNSFNEYQQLLFYPYKGTGCGIYISNGSKYYFRLSSDSGYTITVAESLSPNTTYWFKGVVKNMIAELFVSLDGNNWTSKGTLDISNVANGNNISNTPCVGINGNKSSSWVFGGSIDLNESYIKMGDGYYWRGSHQNINGWKIRYDNLNKNYHIEDGQLTWANPKIYIQNTSTNYIDTGYVAQNNTALIIDFRVDDVRAIASGTRNFICGSDALYNKPGNFYACFWFQGEAASGSRFWLNTTSLGAGYSGSVSSANFILNKYRLILASPYNINYRNSGNTGSASTITQINTGTSVSAISNLESNYGNTSLTVTLFNRKYNLDNSNYYLLGRIYSAEIWENNNLIKKLVPVPKNLKIGEFIVPINGMFDIVNQQFHPSLGSGNLIYNIDEE